MLLMLHREKLVFEKKRNGTFEKIGGRRKFRENGDIWKKQDFWKTRPHLQNYDNHDNDDNNKSSNNNVNNNRNNNNNPRP